MTTLKTTAKKTKDSVFLFFWEKQKKWKNELGIGDYFEKNDIFLTILFFSGLFCFLKYVNMIRISNTGIFFFRFCQKNEKFDWPKGAQTDNSLRESCLV